MKVAIIGGGAAGFFAAINCASENPRNAVFLFEKSNKLLSKVRVSGGGRCNVTHSCFENSRLIEFYPRGMKELRNAFSRFSTTDTVNWFESRGVKLKTEADGRMFPVTDNSETIVQCLMQEANKLNVRINLNYNLQNILRKDDGAFEIKFENGHALLCDRVIITTGGSGDPKKYEWIHALGHSIISPVPSLFTFNIPSSPLKGLEGISMPRVEIKLEGTKLNSIGPVLITHWGLSGPAVLKLSAFAARWLHEKDYKVNCHLNWLPEISQEELKEQLEMLKKNSPAKKFSSLPFFDLPNRLFERISKISGIQEEEKVADLSKTKINALIQNCSGMNLQISGKTTFKEEFVTCGGVALNEVNMQTMESKKVPGIYFAGEVLDIDGVTGGFNFQSAWTTGYLAGINAGS